VNTTEKRSVLDILGWMRSGYPDGVPPKDYFPLLALLKNSLSEAELAQVLGHLLADRPEGSLDREQIEAAITKVTNAAPAEEELRQVAAKLAAGGWPLSGISEHESGAGEHGSADSDPDADAGPESKAGPDESTTPDDAAE
jgi:hypothetical protein